jgi:hypothetical protein
VANFSAFAHITLRGYHLAKRKIGPPRRNWR